MKKILKYWVGLKKYITRIISWSDKSPSDYLDFYMFIASYKS